jgi:hypothetical protein
MIVCCLGGFLCGQKHIPFSVGGQGSCEGSEDLVDFWIPEVRMGGNLDFEYGDLNKNRFTPQKGGKYFMEAGIYGIIGALIGAGISAFTAYLGNRQQLKLKNIELEEQARQEERKAKELRRKEKLQRYASFLSSYWVEEGYLFDIVDQLSMRPQGWSKTIAEIVNAKEHKETVVRLNEGVAWIGLICDDDHAEEMALKVSRSFDRLVTEMNRAKEIVKAGGEVDMDMITEGFDNVRKDLRELSKGLRKDLRVE